MDGAATSDGLTRPKVVGVALDLLNEVGLDGLSTRRLASALGVKSPALYWHFRNKQELLNTMAEALLLSAGMGGPRVGESWRAWLARRAHTYRRTLLAYRDGGRLIASAHPGATVVKLFDEELAALVDLGFTPALALHAIAAVSHYSTGFVLQEQAQRQQEAATAHDQMPDSDEIPTLVAATAAGGATPDRSFDQSLQLILDGIEARLRSMHGAIAESP
jgi:TetR/AcrR family tetracycline transcriptional repressor